MFEISIAYGKHNGITLKKYFNVYKYNKAVSPLINLTFLYFSNPLEIYGLQKIRLNLLEIRAPQI